MEDKKISSQGSGVDSVSVLESESKIEAYVMDESSQLHLKPMDKGKCMELEGVAQELRLLWNDSSEGLEEFLNRNHRNEKIELPKHLDVVCLTQPWPFFKAHFFSEDCSGKLVEIDLFKDASDEFDVYGREDDEWFADSRAWFLCNLVRVNFVRKLGLVV